jgi:hypothetical protein
MRSGFIPAATPERDSRWSSRTLFEHVRDSGEESTDIPLRTLLAAVIDDLVGIA